LTRKLKQWPSTDPARTKNYPHSCRNTATQQISSPAGILCKTEASSSEGVKEVTMVQTDEADRLSATIRQVQQANIENEVQTCEPAFPIEVRTHPLEQISTLNPKSRLPNLPLLPPT